MRLTYLALPLALAACGQQSDEPAPQASETAMPVEPDGGIGDGAGPPAPGPAPSDDDPEQTIPVAVQGSWGLTPADCTSTRGDAKGRLRVSPTTLTFYESVGRLDTVKDRSDSSIRAEFAFTGEGMEWTRDVSLAVRGDTLTRTERGGEEPGSAGPFTYTRCTT